MTILLDSPKPDSPSFEGDHQIAVALAALHDSYVKTRGAGTGTDARPSCCNARLMNKLR
jgi:hypothetical protein